MCWCLLGREESLARIADQMTGKGRLRWRTRPRLTIGGKSYDYDVLHGHGRPGRHRHPQALRRDRHLHLRSRLHLDRQLPVARSPISTATRASCSTAAIRSTSSPSNRPSWRSPICCSTASCRSKDELDKFTYTIIAPHHAARAARDLLSRLPARRAPDGDHVRRGRRALRLLPRQHRHHRSASSG